MIALVQANIGREEVERSEGILKEGYSKKLEKIILFLTMLKKLSRIGQGEFCAFRKHVLKKALTEVLVLVKINYLEGAGAIILRVDTSLRG